MNYIQKIEEALVLFDSMPRVLTPEKLQAIEEQHKGNDVVEYLLSVLKDSRVYDEEGIELRNPVECNSENTHLQNYVYFKKGMGMLDSKGVKFMQYILRNTDALEQKVYLSILQKTIKLEKPEIKPEEKPQELREEKPKQAPTQKPKPKNKRKKQNKANKPAEQFAEGR